MALGVFQYRTHEQEARLLALVHRDQAGWQIVDVKKRWKPHGKSTVVALKGVSDRTGAESLVGAQYLDC